MNYVGDIIFIAYSFSHNMLKLVEIHVNESQLIHSLLLNIIEMLQHRCLLMQTLVSRLVSSKFSRQYLIKSLKLFLPVFFFFEEGRVILCAVSKWRRRLVVPQRLAVIPPLDIRMPHREQFAITGLSSHVLKYIQTGLVKALFGSSFLVPTFSVIIKLYLTIGCY